MDMQAVVLNVTHFKGKIDDSNIDSSKITILGNKFDINSNIATNDSMNLKSGIEVSTYKLDVQAFDKLSKLELPAKVNLTFELNGGKIFFTGFKGDAIPVKF